MTAKKSSLKTAKALKSFKSQRAQGRADRKAAKAAARASQTTVEVTTTTKGINPKTGKPRRKPNVTVLLETDDIVKDQVSGFFTFIREHAIVGLAVGFVIGTQAQAVVKQLIASFIDPSFSLFLGGAKLSERTAIIHLGDNNGEFLWGAMVYALLNLLVVLATVYAIIKLFKLDKLDIAKPAADAKAAKAAKAGKKTKKSAAKRKAKSNSSPAAE